MPLFSGKFAAKKLPARKLNSLLILRRELRQTEKTVDSNAESDDIKLELGKLHVKFDMNSGQWVQESIEEITNIVDHDVQNQNKVLQQENRLLKLKLEILMDMVTEVTAELQLQ